jgi:dCTP deaminase
VSIDLHLGNTFAICRKAPAYLSAVNIDHSLWDSVDLWDHSEQDVYVLEPGKFVLAQTLERVYIPADLVGLVEGRSSWGRMGISIHVTAPKIDPGYDAQITLEMANFGSIPVNLRARIDQPAQLMLIRLSSPVAKADLYGTKADDAFQGQAAPVPQKVRP